MKRSVTIALTVVSIAAVAAIVVIGLSTVKDKPLTPVSASGTQVKPVGWAPQTSDGGGVQITAVPRDGAGLAFEVSMSTHSVELGGYDLARLSRVTLEPGGTMVEAKWEPEGPADGHHVAGVLTFSDPKGLKATAKRIEVEITDVAGVKSRKFQWTADGK